ncbi:MAG TPA: hypothetical protein VJX92_24160, partial [Methylomirabilota bacterium]|nr:hypothetical protein [Methylomirabilota bacterium]
MKGEDPRTARVKQGTVEELQTWPGEEPPAVLASPAATTHPVDWARMGTARAVGSPPQPRPPQPSAAR